MARIENGTPGIDITYEGFSLSYNIYTKIPNWVAWELTAQETDGEEPRARHFSQDPTFILPQADDDDYRNSGWDRGHMAPAADMKWSERSMKESFYLTNVCPQNHNLNAGDWKLLEEQCRNIARELGRVYIVCGPIKGDGINGTIGDGRVQVPDAFFKVLLAKDGIHYKGIGFLFENKAGHKPLASYSLTIDAVEQATGIDFFYRLGDTKEQEMESTVDEQFWSRLLQ